MTNKEKYLQKLAGRESDAVKIAKERIKDRQWLKESQRLAVRILMKLDEEKMSQKELADKVGVSAQYINKLLRGKEKFGWEILISIQNILDLPIIYGYESKKEVKSKSYSEVISIGESNIFSSLKVAEKGIVYGRIISLYGDNDNFESYEPALEM